MSAETQVHQNADRRLGILTEEFLEYARVVDDLGGSERMRAELVQVAAVALANIERLDAGLDSEPDRAARVEPEAIP